MVTTMHSFIEWSPWYAIDDAKYANIPIEPGIYQIQTDFLIGRLRGESQIVSIGSADPSLKTRLLDQRFGNRTRYMNRAEKWLLNAGHKLEFCYSVTKSGTEAKYFEALFLLEYEHEHWELPPGNERIENGKIKQLIKKKHNEDIGQIIRDMMGRNKSTKEIADLLDLPEYVITSMIIIDGIK